MRLESPTAHRLRMSAPGSARAATGLGAMGAGFFSVQNLAPQAASLALGPIGGAAVGMFTSRIFGGGGVPRPAGVKLPPEPPLGSVQLRWNKNSGKMELAQFIRHPGIRQKVWVPMRQTKAMPASAFKGDGRAPLLLPDAPEGIPLTNMGEIDQSVRMAAKQEGLELPWGQIHTGKVLGHDVSKPNVQGVSFPISGEMAAALDAAASAGLSGAADMVVTPSSLRGLGFGPGLFAGAIGSGGGGGFDWGSFGSGLLNSIGQTAAGIGVDFLRQRLGIGAPAQAVPQGSPTPGPLTLGPSTTAPPRQVAVDAGSLEARRDSLRQRLIDAGNRLVAQKVPEATRIAKVQPLHDLYAQLKNWTHEAVNKPSANSRARADQFAAALEEGLRKLEGSSGGGVGGALPLILLGGAALLALSK